MISIAQASGETKTRGNLLAARNGFNLLRVWTISDSLTFPAWIRVKFTSSAYTSVEPLYLWDKAFTTEGRRFLHPAVYDTAKISFIGDPEASGSFDESVVTAAAVAPTRTITLNSRVTLAVYVDNADHTFTGFTAIPIDPTIYSGYLFLNFSGTSVDYEFEDDNLLTGAVPAHTQDEFLIVNLTPASGTFISPDRSVDPNIQPDPAGEGVAHRMYQSATKFWDTFYLMEPKKILVRIIKERTGSSVPEFGTSTALYWNDLEFTEYFAPWIEANLPIQNS